MQHCITPWRIELQLYDNFSICFLNLGNLDADFFFSVLKYFWFLIANKKLQNADVLNKYDKCKRNKNQHWHWPLNFQSLKLPSVEQETIVTDSYLHQWKPVESRCGWQNKEPILWSQPLRSQILTISTTHWLFVRKQTHVQTPRCRLLKCQHCRSHVT